MSDGAELIAAERRRQVHVEGWTPEHDDEHTMGEIAIAARCYALAAWDQTTGNGPMPGGVGAGDEPPWPWHNDWWKPSANPVRNLVKAGALIAAEIDRLQRAGSDSGEGKE